MDRLAHLLSRIWNIVLGRTEKFTEGMETPEDKVKNYLSKLNSEMNELKATTVRVIADEKKLKLQVTELLLEAKDWENKAVLALEHKNELLAQQAVEKRDQVQSKALALKSEWDKQKEIVEKFKSQLEQTQETIEKRKREYNIVLTQYKTAQTQKNITDIIANQSKSSELMDSLKDKVIELQAQTEATSSLSNSGSLNEEFDKLIKSKKSSVALEDLKKRVGYHSTTESDNLKDVTVKKVGS